jgi:hypothetical protein
MQSDSGRDTGGTPMKVLASLLLLVAPWTAALAADGPAEENEPGSKAEFLLPRFRSDRNEFKDNPGLEDALKSVPSVKAEDALFGISLNNGKVRVKGFYTRFTFDPAKADVGDVAKAIAAVPVPQEQQKEPAAILMLFTTERQILSEDQLGRVWKALAEVKGIKVEESRTLRGDEILE